MTDKSVLKREETPLMRQYDKIKSQYPNVILLFRIGDFYETFYDDAKTVSEALGIVLTKRANGAAAEVPLAGFPHHSLETYVEKLVRKGHRVAVCDQVEDPKLARGIVKREVTDVITPGIHFSERLLNEKRNNYLLALHFSKKSSDDVIGIAFVDVTTAEFQVTEISTPQLQDMLHTLSPSEMVFSKREKHRRAILQSLAPSSTILTEMEDWQFSLDYAEEQLRAHFQTHSLKGFGIESFSAGVVAAGVIITYLKETQKGKLSYLKKISPYDASELMLLDPQTKRNLELTQPLNEVQRDATLFGIMDRTKTPMGARLLRNLLTRPSRNKEVIDRRLDAIGKLVSTPSFLSELETLLSGIGDIERTLSRVATSRANPKEVLSLRATFLQIPLLQARVDDIVASGDELHTLLWRTVRGKLHDIAALWDEVGRAISPDAPLNTADGGVIKPGYHAELDDYRFIASNAKDRLIEIQEEERAKTGIASLKVLYNKVFGYYIEVSNANRSKVPSYYERKQTMVNAERYMIPVLKSYEEKILNAEVEMMRLEHELFSNIRERIAAYGVEIQESAEAVAWIDVLCSMARIAIDRDYCRPQLVLDQSLRILQGRHPVLEMLLKEGEKYVANDCTLDAEQRIRLITGPNMSGKSSYLRQVGLIVLLAHVGSFVPAQEAVIGLCDKIFTRVGASDNLAEGESTFLVEMNEAALILNTATSRSVILLDEIGRGTSTFDGMSIAWAITEYIHDFIGAKTLFATHYHELAQLASHLSAVRNFHATVTEADGKVIFLRKISPGAAESSFGIEVAKMAGLPEPVIFRAKEILAHLEHGEEHAPTLPSLTTPKVASLKKKQPQHAENQDRDPYQITLFEIGDEKLRNALRDIDLNKLTPIEALLKLAELKRLLNDA